MDADAIAGLITTLMNLADRYGIGAVITVALIIVLLWLRPYLDRAFNAHITLVQTMAEESPKQTAALERVAEVTEGMKGEKAALHHLSKGIEEIPACEDRRKAVRVHTQNARDALNRHSEG
jgi:hypothetical protein